jgi:hypothetical protein
MLVKFPAVYGTLRLCAVLTIHRHWSLSWAILIQSKPYITRYILILSSDLHLGLPSDFFSSGFPTTIYHLRTRTTHPVHFIFIILLS